MKNYTSPAIEKGIPMPRTSRAYPFEAMEVGDSFWIHRKSISTMMTYWQKKLKFKFAARTVEKDGQRGLRVWRVK